MPKKRNYQDLLDAAYAFAPFRLRDVIDTRYPANAHIPGQCQVCGKKSLRYLCQCTDKTGTTWYIGRDCHTKLDNRQFREKLLPGTGGQACK